MPSDLRLTRARSAAAAVFENGGSSLSSNCQDLLTDPYAFPRAMPLMLDQPEDELGYSYVVHLIVPKILEAKFSRQVIVITHNANIPVLGDADYVTKMENQPNAGSGRACTIASAGSFEDDAVTQALIDLEGGQRAFDFGRHRYALPRSSRVAE